jgi:hypothetical protein
MLLHVQVSNLNTVKPSTLAPKFESLPPSLHQPGHRCATSFSAKMNHENDENDDRKQPAAEVANDNSLELPGVFRNLTNQNIQSVVDTFIRNNPGQITTAISNVLTAMNNQGLRDLVDRLIKTITDNVFRSRLMNALKFHIENHPWQTAFFVVGIILIINPLAVVGFGSLGPTAGKLFIVANDHDVRYSDDRYVGSIAAAWQASYGGTVAAGSAFAILQSLGMLGAVAIPVAGAAVAGSVVVAAAGGNAAMQEVGKWARGEYGEPVKHWWGGTETPVSNWWQGNDTPVRNWWQQVTGQNGQDHKHTE